MTITIPNYQIKEELFQSSRTVIYRALCNSDPILILTNC